MPRKTVSPDRSDEDWLDRKNRKRQEVSSWVDVCLENFSSLL
jgi:hypothetical protein